MASSAQLHASARRRADNRARGGARARSRVRARPIYPGARYKVTRRCLERRLLLAPGEEPERLRDFIGYCLAYTARKYGIQIHAAVVMSNHYHVDLSDPRGQLPAWKQLFNSLLARGVNALRGRFDSFWSCDQPCDTRRPSEDDALADLVYTITNPVEAGLVKWSEQWPGFTTAGWRFGDTRSYRRPEWFFDPQGSMPEEVSLILVRPPIFRELDDEALFEKLSAGVRDRERRAQAKLRAEGRRFMGGNKIAKQSWRRASTSFEPRFGQAPKVAASSRWLQLAELQRDRDWERQYARARRLWRRGEDAVFPAGTYWLRCFAGIAVAERPP